MWAHPGGQAIHHAHVALKFSARHADEGSGPTWRNPTEDYAGIYPQQ
jgi:hypothetical protein